MISSAVLALLLAGSPIKSDEEVVFFPTHARLDEPGMVWLLPVHGWIFEPEKDSTLRREAFDELRESLGLKEEDAKAALFEKRAWPFIVDNERGKELSVRLSRETYRMGESGADGHFRGIVRLPVAEVERLLREQKSKDGWLTFSAVLREGDRRSFTGRVRIVGETGLSVISDIDDTIKVSEVRNPVALVANTFLREFRPVDGMANLYRKWADEGAAFHYVSASPWQLYAPLADFVRDRGFPRGSFHLKEFRWKDSRFVNLFVPSDEIKRKAIVAILEAYPRRRFLLVGDAGERDPELYGELARKYDRVSRVLIRDPDGDPSAERYRKAFDGLARGRWTVFRDPKSLAK